MSAPLLLHSLSELRTILVRLLAAADARSVVEIGSESGAFTRELVAFASNRGGGVTTVEPRPAPAILELARTEPTLRLVEGRSPEALARVTAADAWIVDGDHNFWTVVHELDAALDLGEAAERPPLLVLHDVAWPCGRRDFYYDPEGLPSDAVHAHTFAQGVVPGEPGVVATGGIRGEGRFAVALREGGEQNGVLTAIEAVLARRPGLELAVIPVVFGVGVIWPADAPWADAVRDLLAPYAGLDLLDRLEQNRLRLYAHVLELQDALRRVDGARNRALGALQDRVDALEADNGALRLELARLKATA